ncbi:6933_t:CDS:2, partial [Cetraspora pellucida]
EHLALNCPNQDKDIIDFYTQVVANRQGQSQALSQEIIPGTNLSKRKRKLTSGQTLLSKFLEKLRPGYQPPSKQLFARRLLNAEIIKVNQSIMNILEKASNLTLAGIAGHLWIKMKSNTKKGGLEMLKAQLHQYACNEEPYNGSYVSTIDSPVRWWKTTGDGIETKPERELQTVFQDIDLFSEVNEENNDNLDNLSEFTNFSDPEIEHQDLALENFIELNKVEPDADNENIDRNNEELDEEEFVSEEFDENKFGAEVEELVYSIQ